MNERLGSGVRGLGVSGIEYWIEIGSRVRI